MDVNISYQHNIGGKIMNEERIHQMAENIADRYVRDMNVHKISA